MTTFANKMISVKPMVLKVLQENAESRDDDNLLILCVWEKQAEKEICEFSELKTMLISNRLSTPSSIVRSRRSIQLKNVSLRGLLYAERHNQEIIMKNQMKIEF